MIKVDSICKEIGCLEMRGTLPTLCSEIEGIIRAFKKNLVSQIGEAGAEVIINKIVDGAKLSEEEAAEKAKDFLKERIKEKTEDNTDFKEALDNLFEVINRNISK